MRINHNISAMNTYRQYNTNSGAISKSMEKLSSGYRINRAADDAAGLSISEKMRSQIRGLKQATRNAQDGISFLQTAEGALNEVSDMLTRLKELAVQVKNGTYSNEDKANIGAEMNALGQAITDIYMKTKFNGINVFGTQKLVETSAEVPDTDFINAFNADIATPANAKFIGFTNDKWYISDDKDIDDTDTAITAGPDLSDQLDTAKVYYVKDEKVYNVNTDGSPNLDDEVEFTKTSTTTQNILDSADITEEAAVIKYGEDGGQNVTIMTASTAALNKLLEVTINPETSADNITDKLVEDAISEVNTTRANYGALQNQLEHASNNMATTKENLQAAESRVRDVDMAEEMMEYTKNNILLQAAQAMLAQANSQPQGVLQLLQ